MDAGSGLSYGDSFREERLHSRSPCKLPAGAELAEVESIPAMEITGSIHSVDNMDVGNQ